MFGQRSYIRYGNGVETRYSYSSNRRRLSNLTVNANNVKVMDNTYRYDVMDNIVGLIGQGKPQTLQDGKSIGGAISHTYAYDEWDRLIGAKGTFNGGGSKSATYNLHMEYDKLYNVTKKQLNLTQNDLQFQGSLTTGYELTYNYKEDDPFRLESIDTKQYSNDGEAEADTIKRVNSYTFDENGNLTFQLVDTQKDSAHVADTMGTRVKNHLWDEENRLLAINDNGFVSNYFYDASGERTVKLSKPDLYVYVNSAEKLKGDSLPVKFVGYVNPYLVVTNGGKYTKHIYAGSQRIASKLGDINAFGADPRRVEAAGHDVDNVEMQHFSEKYSKQNTAFKARFDSLNVKFVGKTLDDYVNGKSFCCGDNSTDEIERNNDKPENAKKEDNLYFYHPDHLGSTNLITNFDGEVTQSVAYIPYGEVFVEERNGSWATPFLFNAKELDEETGLYYYGARYLDPMDARWLSPDPKWDDYKGVSPYAYCLNNPVKLIDPSGEDVFYDEDGNYIGSDKNGYAGKIFITTKAAYEQNPNNVEGAVPLQEAGLTAQAYANVYTDVLEQNGISRNNLYNGSVSVKGRPVISKMDANGISSTKIDPDCMYNDPYKDVRFLCTNMSGVDRESGVRISVNQGASNTKTLTTVENVYNSIGIHEYKGHGQNGYADAKGNHHKAYLDQISHSSWNKATDDYKRIMIYNLFNEYVTGNHKEKIDYSSSSYRKAYNEYEKYYGTKK